MQCEHMMLSNACTNPRVYIARYFGYHLHVDQNEKMAMFGLVYVLARDGFSGKIVAGAVMNRKNNMKCIDLLC